VARVKYVDCHEVRTYRAIHSRRKSTMARIVADATSAVDWFCTMAASSDHNVTETALDAVKCKL
jgi:hypothetical protein